MISCRGFSDIQKAPATQPGPFSCPRFTSSRPGPIVSLRPAVYHQEAPIPKPAAKENASLDALLAEDVAAPPPDKLKAVKDKVRELRDLVLEKESLESRQEEIAKSINFIQSKELVDLFAEVGIDTLGLEPEGNLPAFDAKAKPFYHANIKNDSPTAPKAYEWLLKQGHGDLVKRTYTIVFGKGEEKRATAFEAALKKLKVDYGSAFGVPWNSLTAFVREQTERFDRLPPPEQTNDKRLPLDLLGATVGRVVTIKARKEK